METLQLPRDIFLKMTGIEKSFVGSRVLRGVDLDVKIGEVHGLVGRNGAGKSTLMGALMGLFPIDGGVVTVDGKILTEVTPERSISAGIAMVPQQLLMFGALTITENVLGEHLCMNSNGYIDWGRSHERASILLEKVGLDVDTRQLFEQLSLGDRQMVAIARALFANARLVILDEPTATLGAPEIETLFSFVKRQSATGVSFIYISHHLEEIYQLCDRVTVLRDGESIVTSRVKALPLAELIQLMGVSKGERIAGERQQLATEVSIEAKNLELHEHFRNVSFTLRHGEVMGLTGLEGCGKEQLVQSMFGLKSGLKGSLTIDGHASLPSSPREALNLGIAYLPRDRRRFGIVGVSSVLENLSLCSLKKLTNRMGFLKRRTEKIQAYQSIVDFSIKTLSIGMECQLLSGGNQQKVVFAKVAQTIPRLLLLEEPTQGVDVQAKGEIWSVVHRLVKHGTSVILVTEEAQDLLEHCDSYLILRKGESQGQVPLSRAGVSSAQLIAAMEGVQL